MSDHSDAPVAAYEPPYYVAVFTTVRTKEQSGYSETNARMEDLVKDIPGFLGMDHAQTPGGLGITVSYFSDADALAEWRNNAEHRTAQKRGRAEWYQSYTLHVAKSGAEPRVHTSRRPAEPNSRLTHRGHLSDRSTTSPHRTRRTPIASPVRHRTEPHAATAESV